MMLYVCSFVSLAANDGGLKEVFKKEGIEVPQFKFTKQFVRCTTV